MAERALGRGDRENGIAHARAAARAYEAGFKADVRAYYPGVNIVALYRLLGQYWEPNNEDLDRAREILPVVGFVQSFWPWLRDIGIPLVRGWLGL